MILLAQNRKYKIKILMIDFRKHSGKIDRQLDVMLIQILKIRFKIIIKHSNILNRCKKYSV